MKQLLWRLRFAREFRRLLEGHISWRNCWAISGGSWEMFADEQSPEEAAADELDAWQQSQ